MITPKEKFLRWVNRQITWTSRRYFNVNLSSYCLLCGTTTSTYTVWLCGRPVYRESFTRRSDPSDWQ